MINIIREKRRTISISIDEKGAVIVKAPVFISNEKINDFIKSKNKWIDRKVKEKSQILSENSLVINKQKALYLGEIIKYSDDYEAMLTVKANEYLKERLRFLANKYNFNYGNVRVKNYKSRWGTCYKNKDITLNVKLMAIDKDLIDYVILHELCHTIHFNHKREFHNLLSNIIGNEKEYKTRLNKYSFILKIEY